MGNGWSVEFCPSAVPRTQFSEVGRSHCGEGVDPRIPSDEESGTLQWAEHEHGARDGLGFSG